ncbi:MAG: protein kinase [Myxococcota bacterium]|jgi:serine/threonine protein kinase|nr:protein kinase [Myxococcota bacterium]
MDARVGRSLGDYRIDAPLGRGGMATVYRATHLPSGRVVALKTVDVSNERVVRSIRREVRALARLRHPGIVRVLDDGVDEGAPWYAMELVEGRTLGALLPSTEGETLAGSEPWWTRTLVDPPSTVATPESDAALHPTRAKLPLDRALTIARALCESLAHLHGEGLVHRDLKPDNVLVRDDGAPVLVDFGLASLAPRETSREVLEVRGELAGTAAYMAPESIRGEPVDARADLYALGCMIYEMCTGSRPFAAFTVAAVLRGHLEVLPLPPSSIVPELPRELDALVGRLLEKDPSRRPGHADDVGRALERLGAAPPTHSLPARDYLYRPRMAGRASALESLVAALDATRRGRGSLWVVFGESGIGKTRLVNELATRAAAHGVDVLDAEHSSTSATHPLRALLRALVERCRARGEGESLRIFGGRAEVLAALEPEIATLTELSPIGTPPSLEGDAGRVRLVRALAEALRAAASRRLVWIVDDVQWADSLTLAVLAYLAREQGRAPLLVLATCRSEETTDAVRALAKDASALSLTRLPPHDVGAIAGDMLAHEPPPELMNHLVRHSEGNPFFVAEYLRAALEETRLRRDAQGRWRLDEGAGPIARQPLPDTLRALIARRLDALSPAARTLADLASIAGESLGTRDLALLAGLDETSAYGALDELARREVAHETPRGTLRFAHDKLREFAYERFEPDARRALHASVARTLDEDSDELAQHWLEAGDTPRAVDAADGIGRRALARWSYSLAAESFGLTLTHAPSDDPRRAGWEQALAEAKLGLGALSASQTHLLRALALRGSPAPTTGAGLARRVVAQIGVQLSHRVWRAPADVDPGGTQALARTHQRLVESYWFDNDVARMLEAALSALNLAERAGDSPELVRAYATMSIAVGGVPLGSFLPPRPGSGAAFHPLAERYAELAREAAARVADPAAEAYALFLTSVFRIGTGQFDRVERDLERAAAINERIGDPRFLGESLTVLAMSTLYRGDFARAAQRFAEVALLGKRHDNAQHRAWAALGEAEARLRLGEREAARAATELARAELESSTAQTLERMRFEGLLAQASARDDVAAALDHARRARRHAAELPAPTAHYLLEGYAGPAHACLVAWSRGGASRAEALATLGALEAYAFFFRIGVPRALRLRGDAAWIAGRPTVARVCWRRAAERAAALGMRWEHERALDAETDARSTFGAR